MKGFFATALLLAGLVVCLAEVSELLDQQDFATWAKLFERTYHNTDEAALRQKVFDSNVKTINAHNAGPSLFKVCLSHGMPSATSDFQF